MKRIRLFAYSLLAALMALSLASAALAETAVPDSSFPPDRIAADQPAIDRKKAEEHARRFLALESDFELTNASFHEDSIGRRWSLEFIKKKGDRLLADVFVSLDADSGRLIGFEKHANDPVQQTTYPPKYDFQAAKLVAERFVREMNAAEIDQLRYNTDEEAMFRTPLQGPVFYPFRYDRIVDGIAYPEHFVYVRVDGAGNVVGYQFVWSDKVEFAPATDLIDAEQAKARVLEKAGVRLQLIMPYTAQNQTPRYAYVWTSSRMNAKTGELDVLAGPITPMADKPAANSGRPATPLSREQAVEVAKSLLPIPADARLANASYYEDRNKSAVWMMEWRTGTDDAKHPEDGTVYWASIDAATGEPVGFGSSRSYRSVGPMKDDARAKAIATDYVRRVYASRLHELAQPTGEAGVYYFQRLAGGVPVESEGVHLVVGEDGTVLSLERHISAIDYPAVKPKVLSEAEARAKLMDAYTLRLQYMSAQNSPELAVPPEKYRAAIAAGIALPGSQAGLRAEPYYVLVTKRPADVGIFLDATDGKFYRRDNGKEYFLDTPETSDLNGHWAENELRLMLEYGAIEAEGGLALPDKPITRGEMIKMLLIAVSGGWFETGYANGRSATFADVPVDSTYFAYVEYAVDNRLIDPTAERFRPGDPVTREELAALIVRALGYAKLADYGGLFRLDVADADNIRNKGQVAIAIGLGIMTPDEGGRFRPTETVTRAQAAVAFYRYLQKRAELQDVGPWR